MAAWRAIWIGALGLTAAGSAVAQTPVELFGVEEATLEWSPATGAVSGYYVIVSRNGGDPSLHGVSGDTRETVPAPIGDVITVQVAAFDAAGLAGPVSAPSLPLRFNPASTPPPSGGGGGSTPQPPDEPDEPDAPTPDDPDQIPIAGPARFDFSGDGRSDLLLRDLDSGTLELWTLDEVQVAKRGTLAHLPYPWALEASGDYDGDGNSDLLWRNAESGKLTLWLVREGKVVGGDALDKTGEWLSRAWKVRGSADFDADGRDDLVLAVSSKGAVEILLMDGATVRSRISRSAPSPDWLVAATPDTDGDGIAELVWEQRRSHALALEWIAKPRQTHALGAQLPGWQLLGSADFDGDGRDELLMHSTKGRRVEAWGFDGAQVRASDWSAQPGDRSWEFRGLGDFDGDGRADSFWHHPDDGFVEVWFSDTARVEPAFISEQTGNARVVGDQGD